MSWIKTYSVSDDTLNGLADAGSLRQDIEGSSITIQIAGVSVSGDIISCTFATEISESEKVTLLSVINNHVGNTLEPTPETVTLYEHDPETGGVMFTPRYQPQGWLQQLFEVEFQTSTLNSIHEKDANNNDIGWSSLKFYKDVNGVETEWTPSDQSDLDANCIRTDFSWMPTIDYQILSGQIAQMETPAENFYVWGHGIDLDTAYGGPQVVFAEGGINMAYVGSHTAVGLKGKGAPFLYYSKVKTGIDSNGNSVFQDLPPGVGSNRMRFLCRHGAGFKHRLQPIFEIFRET